MVTFCHWILLHGKTVFMLMLLQYIISRHEPMDMLDLSLCNLSLGCWDAFYRHAFHHLRAHACPCVKSDFLEHGSNFVQMPFTTTLVCEWIWMRVCLDHSSPICFNTDSIILTSVNMQQTEMHMFFKTRNLIF